MGRYCRAAGVGRHRTADQSDAVPRARYLEAKLPGIAEFGSVGKVDVEREPLRPVHGSKLCHKLSTLCDRGYRDVRVSSGLVVEDLVAIEIRSLRL